MRYVLLLFFVFLAGLGFSQRIQIEGVEVNYSSVIRTDRCMLSVGLRLKLLRKVR